MSHGSRDRSKNPKYTPEQREKILEQPKWKYCRYQVDPRVLEEHFDFLNQGVVIRGDAQGVPLMTTTGIYGPIHPDDTVTLHQDPMRTVHIDSLEKVEESQQTFVEPIEGLKSGNRRAASRSLRKSSSEMGKRKRRR